MAISTNIQISSELLAITSPSEIKKNTSLFRLSIVLRENINEETLHNALATCLEINPDFAYNYFKGYQFKVACDYNRINLDVFKNAADEVESLEFCLALVAQYIRLYYGESIDEGAILFDSPLSRLRKYHIEGVVEPYDVIHNMKVEIATTDLSKRAAEQECTVNELLSDVMFRALARVKTKRHLFLADLGETTLPAAMDKYIYSIEFLQGRRKKSHGTCACISYNGKTILNFSGMSRKDNYAYQFARELIDRGIECSLYQM